MLVNAVAHWLEGAPSYWCVVALAGMAILIVLGLGLWRAKSTKLFRAIRLENRGMRLLIRGHHDNAEDLLIQSLRLAEDADGPDGPDVAPILANVAQVYWFQERHADAERYYLRAIEVRQNAVGPEDPFLAPMLNNLATLYQNQNREDEAAPLLARANAIRNTASEQETNAAFKRFFIS